MKRLIFAMGVFVGIVILLSFSNHWIKGQLTEIEDDRAQDINDAAFEVEVPRAVASAGSMLICKTKLEPNRRFTFNKVYVDDQKVANFKMKNSEVYDVTGLIPDGKIQFSNEDTGEYGEYEFLNGKRNGMTKIYYSEGQLKEESTYLNGQLQLRKIYFKNGKIRSDEDYRDALYTVEANDLEVGVGKMYDKKGALTYEWNVTTSNEKKYTRSYNSSGVMIEEVLYDILGNEIERNVPGLETEEEEFVAQ